VNRREQVVLRAALAIGLAGFWLAATIAMTARG
jgi:hypothetical protein